MKKKYREAHRGPGDRFPKLNANEKIIGMTIESGRGLWPPLMILLIEETTPFRSRIKKR